MPSFLKQLVVYAAVAAIAVVFIVQFRPGADAKTTSGPRCAIEIKGDCISHDDFVATYRMAAPPRTDDEVLRRYRLREAVVDGLVERWLLVRDAERLGVSVSEEDVTRVLAKGYARMSLPAAREEYFAALLGLLAPPEGPARQMYVRTGKDGGFDKQRYRRWVGEFANKTVKGFHEFQRVETIAARMRALVRSRVRVGEAEARARHARENEKVAADYVKLERDYFEKHAVDRSKDKLDAWLGAHEAEVEEAWKKDKETFLPTCRAARHLLVRFDPAAGDKEAQKNKALERIEQARRRLDAGEKFGDVAGELSEDDETAPSGGDLGCFAPGKLGRGATDKAVGEAAWKLAAGKVSDVVESEHGLHLVRVDKIHDGAAAEKFGRREVAARLYLRGEADRMAAEGAKRILAAVQGGKSLGDAVHAELEAVLLPEAKEAYAAGRAAGEEKKAEGRRRDAWTDAGRPRVEKGEPFAASGPPFGGIQNPAEAARMLFALSTPGGVAPETIKLYDGYAVATLRERAPVKDEDWDKARAEYVARLRREKQNDALADYVARLRAAYDKDIVLYVKLGDDVKGAPSAAPIAPEGEE
jgi:peptidyl-prolyl cis-trans isomerase D